MNKTLHDTALEFDVIIEKVSEHTVSREGKEKIVSLTRYKKKQLLQKELERITEMADLLKYDDHFPLQGYGELIPYLNKAEIDGSYIPPEGLFILLRFLQIIEKINNYINHRKDKYPLLKKITNHFNYLVFLQQEIKNILDAKGNIKPKASEKLYTLHKQIEDKRIKIRKKLESKLHTLLNKGYARDDHLVIRQGRLALPVKETYRSSVKGIVIDQSASGATVFIEPLDIIELNNQVHKLESEKTKEIERILIKVTNIVRDNISELKGNIDSFSDLDSIYAKAQFSLKLDCIPAEINNQDKLNLKNARHPLLLLRNSNAEIVPLSIEMNQNIRTVIITGPNAGGKTVALKTAGLLSLMHNYGYHIPAEEGSSIPLYSGIFADIGDRQSIQHDLSTFSSHIERLNRILQESDTHSLVLLDEIGSSTDPIEGAALAEVILEYLTELGCLTIATTHMGALKVFAHQHKFIENGSMLFDSKKLSPSYRFQMGLPGSSYAFEIAEKYGMDPEIIQKARKRIGEERGKLDTLILQLENEIQKSSRLTKEAEIKHSKLEGLIQLYQERLDKITKQGQKERKRIVDEAEEFLKNANVDIENIIREIKEKQAARSTIRTAKNTIQQKQDTIKKLQHNQNVPDQKTLKKGEWAFWHGHSGKGKIISDSDSTGRVLVDWDGIRLKVPLQELQTTRECDQDEKQTSEINFVSVAKIDDSIGNEIDLRGMRAEDAIITVDKYLSDAVMAGFHAVRIIHGKGSGVLREVIGRHLKEHNLVKNFRLGRWNEGDTGVTIVEIE
ncbi:MAG: endonuclease MutS2 [bacterium]